MRSFSFRISNNREWTRYCLMIRTQNAELVHKSGRPEVPNGELTSKGQELRALRKLGRPNACNGVRNASRQSGQLSYMVRVLNNLKKNLDHHVIWMYLDPCSNFNWRKLQKKIPYNEILRKFLWKLKRASIKILKKWKETRVNVRQSW